MASWSEFAALGRKQAAHGHRLLFRAGAGEGLLTTVSGEGLPRTHPVNVGIVEGRLLVFVQGRSAKHRDLATDGRYALHAHQDPAQPHEFLLRGRASLVTDAGLRARAIASWAFAADDDYPLYELDIEHALAGERADPDAWPPRYISWRPRTAAAAATG